MQLDNYTIKSQAVIQKALSIAEGHSHQSIEAGHLLLALFAEADDIVSYLLKKLSANDIAVKAAAEKIVSGYPRVTGGSTYLSPAANKILSSAQIGIEDGRPVHFGRTYSPRHCQRAGSYRPVAP